MVYFDWLRGVSLPFLLTEYSEFTSEWYLRVGSTIVVTMFLMVFTPHISNWMFQLLYSCRRCWDRSCTCNSKRTHKLVQEDYEAINIGNDFMLEFRYANMLTVLSVVFFYSGGMPILYPIAACFFFVTYWMDKCLLFKCYKKPIQFDSHIAISTLSLFKYIIVLHIIGCLLMFGLTPILPHTSIDFGDKSSKSVNFESEDGTFSLYSLYIWLIILIIVAWIIYNLPVRFLQRCA